MRRRSIAPFVLVLWYVASAAARFDQTDDFIREEMKRQNIPGLALAIVKEGKLVKAEGYGFADLRAKTPATPDTVFKIASVSKQFIAAGIVKLAQDGRMSFDDPVHKHIDGAPAAWSGITVRHLLTHTAGLVREAPGFHPARVQSDADVIKTAYSLPLRFTPGEKYEYSNLGYFMLADIIRKVSGKPWTDYLRDAIFTPAGMTSTYPTSTTETIAKRARGYVDNDELRDAPRWAALRPSGAFLSTVLDLAKWEAVLYTDAILNEASRRQMWTPVTLNNGSTHSYGFGWALGHVAGQQAVHHWGGMPGARAAYARFREHRVAIIALMNLDDVNIEAVIEGLVAIHLPAPVRR